MQTICVDCGEEVEVEESRDERCQTCLDADLESDAKGPLAVDYYMERVRKRGWWA